MSGAERGAIPQQCIIIETIYGIGQVRDIGGVRRHIVLGRFQLRTVDGVSTGGRKVTSSNVSDFAGGVGAVSGAERGAIPQQCIIIETVYGIGQVGDVGGVSRHIVFGGFQLRTVNGVGTGGRNCTVCNVNDFVLGYGALYGAISVFDNIAGTECSLTFVPVQGVIVDSGKRFPHIIVGAAFHLVAWRIYSSICIYGSTTPESVRD